MPASSAAALRGWRQADARAPWGDRAASARRRPDAVSRAGVEGRKRRTPGCRHRRCARSHGSALTRWPPSRNHGARRDGRLPSRASRRALLALLLELLANALALQIGQVVDEQLAVEVIHLVLDAHGQQFHRSRARRPRRCDPEHARGPSRRAALRRRCPGTDRQPSSVTSTPSRARISGLMRPAAGCAPPTRR